MKLLIDEPGTSIKDAKILFGFDSIAKTLGQAIIDSEPNFNLGIYGPWGSGKTTLLRLIRKCVNEDEDAQQSPRKFLTVEFSAWEFQDLEYPLQALAQVIFGAIEARAKEEGERSIWSKVIGPSARMRLLKYIADHTPRQFAFSLLGNGIEYDRGESGGTDFATLCSQLLPLTNEIAIVTYVDDLDRCPPDFQVRFLDAIKTFFNLPGYVFVLALDHERVLGSLVKSSLHQLDDTFEASCYLDKVIHVSWHLRPPSVSERETFLQESILLLNSYNGATVINLDENRDELGEVARLEDNPRRLKALLNGFALRWRDQKDARFGCYVTYSQIEKTDPRFLALVETATILKGAEFLPELWQFITMKMNSPSPEQEIEAAKSRLRDILGTPLLDDIDGCRTSQIGRIINGETGRRLFTPMMWRAVVRGQGVMHIRREPEPVLRFFQFGSYLTYLPLHFACERGFMAGYAIEFGGPTFNDRDNYLLVSGRGDGELVFGLADPLDLCKPDATCIVIAPVVTQVALWLVAKASTGLPTEERLKSDPIATYKPDTTCHRLVTYYREGALPNRTYDPAIALDLLKSGAAELLVMQEPDVTKASAQGLGEDKSLWLGSIFADYPFSAIYTHRRLLNTASGQRAASAVSEGVSRALRELRRASENIKSPLGRDVVSFVANKYNIEEDIAEQAFVRLSQCFATDNLERSFSANLSTWHSNFVKLGLLADTAIDFNAIYPRALIQDAVSRSAS
jgi:hypothetical protein